LLGNVSELATVIGRACSYLGENSRRAHPKRFSRCLSQACGAGRQPRRRSRVRHCPNGIAPKAARHAPDLAGRNDGRSAPRHGALGPNHVVRGRDLFLRPTERHDAQGPVYEVEAKRLARRAPRRVGCRRGDGIERSSSRPARKRSHTARHGAPGLTPGIPKVSVSHEPWRIAATQQKREFQRVAS